jgi:hypothetical protein
MKIGRRSSESEVDDYLAWWSSETVVLTQGHGTEDLVIMIMLGRSMDSVGRSRLIAEKM